MAEWTLKTTDAEIDAALERARLNPDPDPPSATTAEYRAELDLVILHLDTGRRLVLPREELQGLQTATPDQLAHIEIFGGRDIAWPDLDVDHYLPSLIAGIYGSDRWMQSLNRSTAAA